MEKKIVKKVACILMLFYVMSFFQDLLAVIAYPYPVKFKQPNGDTLTVIMRGDEFAKYAESVDGYTLLYDNKGYLCYAEKDQKGNLVPSIYSATNIVKRSNSTRVFLQNIAPGLMFGDDQRKEIKTRKVTALKSGTNTFPTKGQRKLLCILVDFQDKRFTKAQTEFNQLFNQTGYSMEGAKGSVKDYFKEVSYNQLDLSVDVVGPYTCKNSMAYYGNNTNGALLEFAREAFAAADDVVNYSDYDNDKDGYVDGVYIIYAGYGEEAGGGANTIWAHAARGFSPTQYDGVWVNSYSCSPELRSNAGSNITYIGVICHEFGHTLGAYDFYDIDYSVGGQYEGTGNWDLQAGGSWNDEGRSPAHPNPRTKIETYGWATATELTSAQSGVELQPAEFNKDAFRIIKTVTPGEYYLLENRQQTGFDSGLPGNGLMIYHAHSALTPYTTDINNTHPQLFYPVAANAPVSIPLSGSANYGNVNIASCLWGHIANQQFSDFSIPSMRSWAGKNTNKPISGIRQSGQNVYFDFMLASFDPTEFKVQSSTTTAITLSWQLSENRNIILIGGTSPVTDIPQNGKNYEVGTFMSGGAQVLAVGDLTSFTHTNLQPSTRYYYTVFSKVTDTPVWSGGKTLLAKTQEGKIGSFPYKETFDNENNLPPYYIVEKITGSADWKIQTFVNGNIAHIVSTTASQTKLISPVFDINKLQNPTLSFEYKNSNVEANASWLKVLYRISATSEWKDLGVFDKNTSGFSKEKIVISESAPYWQLAFEAKVSDNADISIDNIMLYSAGEYTVTFNAQGGSVSPANKTITNGQVYGILPVPQKSGFTFGGWFTNPEGGGTNITNNTEVLLSSDITLYAKWLTASYFERGHMQISNFNAGALGAAITSLLPSGFTNSDITSIKVIGQMTDADFKSIGYSAAGSDFGGTGTQVLPNCKSVDLSEVTGITNIPNKAFLECKNLNTFIFPKTGVKETGMWSFIRSGITTIEFPDGFTSIGMSSFLDCAALSEVVLPSTLTILDPIAFGGCIELKEFTLSSDNPAFSTREGILFDKAGTKLVVYPAGKSTVANIPEGTTEIGSKAFYNNTELTGIVTPESLTTIRDWVFVGCSKLASFHIPQKTTVVEGFGTTFMNCSSLKSITVDEQNPLFKSVEGVWFNKEGTTLYLCPVARGISTYTIPEGVEKIEDLAFYKVKGLSLSFPATLTTIKNEVFWEWTGQTVLDFSACRLLTNINQNAFRGCTDIKTLKLPASVQKIDAWCFKNCSNLNNITCATYKEPEIGSEAFVGGPSSRTVMIPNASNGFTAGNWGTNVTLVYNTENLDLTYNFNTTTGKLTVSGKGAQLEYLKVASAIGKAEYYLTDTRLKEVDLSGAPNLKVIEKYSFYDCEALSTINIPNTVELIDNNAFYRCKQLSNISLPDKLISIGESAFYDCANIKSVIIPDGVQKIGSNSFFNTGISTVSIPNTTTSIGESAFDFCKKLTAINVGSANKQYSSIDGVLFNKKITTILCYPWAKSGSVYSTPATITTIAPYAFRVCMNLKKIVVNEGVTSIAERGFYNSYASSVILPATLQSIGMYGFGYCLYLSSITFAGKTEPFMAEYVFDTNIATKTVYLPNASNGFTAGNWGTGVTLRYGLLPADVHTVIFDSQGGSAIPNGLYFTGAIIPQPENPVLSGYNFAGWYKEKTLINQWNFGVNTMPDADLTLYARWLLTTSTNNISDSRYKIYSQAGTIIIEGLDYGDKFNINSVNGSLVYSGSNTGINRKKYVVPNGVYIVSINNGLIVKKVIVQ